MINKTQILHIEKTQQWYLIDAKNHRVGRIATEIANILRGKRQVSFHPSQSTANHVIIINAQEIKVSGNKSEQKLYYKHSGRPGSLKIERFENLQQRLPHKIIENAVKGMLPKGPLGRQIFKNLKVYAGEQHPHTAQQPINIEL
uniref:Large ribosomal subunit protein uL13c n=1 Tax=Helminthora furcellata TaxID=1884666 RepID=A0A1G4NRB6_9FLOR|nr:Ribosomal protein L13 [Helminthora furcellata]SCW21202.1 Ribosomal protein L13 [Helminthora furcellata]SCW24062.1 Ribosomal protein L13 [Helminthora furcellata]